MSTLRIATRKSDLALAQARFVGRLVEERLGRKVALVPMSTRGDRLKGPLKEAGGKGLFVKEIEEALLDGRADLAVHSAKDLPALTPGGLELSAFPDRADPRDALVARERGATLAELPSGARVGTGSVRRSALLEAARPDLEVVSLRGNVPTRLAKLDAENLDAVILACAGLDRLGYADRIDERISPDVMLPAVAQGILALETRIGDERTADLRVLDDPRAASAAAAERGFLIRVGGDCGVPMAAFAEHREKDRLRVRGLVISLDGKRAAKAECEVPAAEALEAGGRLAAQVLAEGGSDILAELRGASPS